MTIKDLYDWAVANGVTDYNILLGKTFMIDTYTLQTDDVDYFDVNNDNKTITI